MKIAEGLPERCYTWVVSPGVIGLIVRGETGYYKVTEPVKKPFKDMNEIMKKVVQERNNCLGVSEEEQFAMEAGSIFGWDCPAADPKNFGKDFTLVCE